MEHVSMAINYSAVLVRYGELGLKSNQTRRRMTDLLIREMRCALEKDQIPFDNIRSEWGRIFIETKDALKAAKTASQIFGVVSTSPVVETSAYLEDILQKGEALAKLEFKKGLPFAVRARRVGEHTYSSQDIREKLGERIIQNLSDLELTVNLSSPKQKISVEVRDNRAYVFTAIIKGVGGMPTGSQGKVVCLISTGLDSPVATYKVMKRGCIPIFVYADNLPHSDDSCVDVAIKQAETLAKFIHSHELKMYIVPHGPDLDDILEHAPKKMTCIFCKRNMLRLAREIAFKENADCIVTGEIIGEQASQTTQNLRSIESAVCDYPILRPCAGDDKVDIEKLARQIGTYDFTSESVSCCSLAPEHPIIQSNIDDVHSIDEKLNHTILEQEISLAKVLLLGENS
jgi:thiamine biosynthesis protein ThiI